MPSARWCGRCGHPVEGPEPRTPSQPSTDVVLPIVDDEPVVAAAPARAPFSGRSRLIGAAVVLLVLGGLLVVQASRPAPAEPHGYTDRGVPARTGVASVAPVSRPERVAWESALELPTFIPAGAVVHASETLAYVLDLDGGAGVTAHELATGEIRWARPDLALSEAQPVIARDTLVVATRDGDSVAIGPDGATRWTTEFRLEHPVAAGGAIVNLRMGQVIEPWRTRVELWEPATGDIRWSIDLTATLDVSAQFVLPGAPDDLVVVLANSPPGLELGENPELERNHLVGIESRTGEIRWVIDLPRALAWFQNPVAVDDRVAVAANVTSISFWDLDSGRLLAEHARPIAFRPLTVAAAGGAALLLDPLGTISSLEPDGDVRWSIDVTLPTTIDVRGDTVVVSTDQRIRVLDAATGETIGGLPVDPGDRAGPPAPDGGAFVLHRDGRLVAYSPREGRRFEQPTLVPPTSAPAIADGVVYASTGSGVAVLSAEDGTPLWEYRSTDPTASIAGDLYSPVVTDEVVIVSPPRSQPLQVGGLFALQRDTGILAWQRLMDRPSPRGPLTYDRDLAVVPVEDELHGHAPIGGRRALAAPVDAPRGPVAAAGGLLVATTTSGTARERTIVAVRRADRTRVWEEPLDACTPPAIAEGLVLVGTDRGIRALDLATGAHRWNAVIADHPVCGDLVASGGVAIGVSGGVSLVAAELAGGAPAWDLDLPAAAAAPPAGAGDEVLVPLVDGTLVAVGVADGELRWSVTLGGIPAASPVVAGEKVLVLLRDGRLIALEPA